MQDEQIISLIEAYAAGTITPSDERLFFEWYRKAGIEEFTRLYSQAQVFSDAGDFMQKMPHDFKQRLEASLDKVDLKEEKDSARKAKLIKPIWRWAAAAAIILSLSSGLYYLINRPKAKTGASDLQIASSPINVSPGSNKAVLTLGNGKQIVLDSMHVGTIAKQDNANIEKTDSGKLAYNALQEKQRAVEYNVLSTPRGGQYQLQLPDGTKVWLNASSSIKYPTAFIGKERMVEITGEAYFEVVHNEKMPFKVKAENQVIEDVGTSFDVMAYNNETNKLVTVVEGEVKVGGQKSSVDLKAGEQAMSSNDGDIQVDPNADTHLATAWKNGYTSFKSADIKTIMRQVERWYDLDVSYEGEIPERRFTGDISRSANLSELIQLLEASKIHFELKGKQLYVKP